MCMIVVFKTISNFVIPFIFKRFETFAERILSALLEQWFFSSFGAPSSYDGIGALLYVDYLVNRDLYLASRLDLSGFWMPPDTKEGKSAGRWRAGITSPLSCILRVRNIS